MLKSIFHWKVLVNLLLAVAVFAGLVWLTFRWLEYHTNHGKEIQVPSVVNMNVQNAIKVLDDAGLAYEVDSFKYDPKYKPLQVLQIFPSSGSRVKDGRTIILKVNPRTWAKVVVPDVLDRYKGLAFRQLDVVGLKVGDTIFEPNIQRDAVIRMMYNGSTVKPGSLLPRFSTIDLVIGTGPKRNVAVPSIVGLTLQQARAIIASNYFEVGLVEHEDGGKDESDIVYYQDPEAGSLRDQGMQIDLWVSKKTPGQMSAKIAQLDNLYRAKIDTSLPPVRYEEVPVYRQQEPEPEEEPEPAARAQPERQKTAAPEPKKQEVKKAEPKKTEQRKEEPKKSSKTTSEKPKETPKQAPQEKPKVKKIIVE